MPVKKITKKKVGDDSALVLNLIDDPALAESTVSMPEPAPEPREPYHDLRFHPLTYTHRPRARLKTTKVPVLKMRPAFAETLRGQRQATATPREPVLGGYQNQPPPQQQNQRHQSIHPYYQHQHHLSQPNFHQQQLQTQIMLPPVSTAASTRSSPIRSMRKTQADIKGLDHFVKDRSANVLLLDPKALMGRPMTTWISPGQRPLFRPSPLQLQRRPSSGHSRQFSSYSNLRKEMNSLANYEQNKKKQLEMENSLMAKLNRPRANLLIRRGQVLPMIERGGYEKSPFKMDGCGTPPPCRPPVENLFNYALNGYDRKGLKATLTRSQRGHKVITEWHGAPHVTDSILKQMGLAPATEEAVLLREKQQQEVWGDASSGEFVPLFPGLGVVGMTYRQALCKRYIRTVKSPVVTPIDNSLVAHSAQQQQQHHHYQQQQEQQEQQHQQQQQQQQLFSDAPSNAVSDTGGGAASEAGGPEPDGNDSRVVLVFGQRSLSWCAPGDGRAKKSCVVEIGCSAELGQSAVSFTSIRNAGTVAIRYNWVRCDRKDAFQLQHQCNARFAFDSWGGVIFPGETHRVPCLYKANEPGFFSEDWRLETRPVLEAGAKVILRLWGVTRKLDASKRDRLAVERYIQTMITENLVAHRVQKIIDNLPLKEVPLKDTRFPLVHRGPDLFRLKNPAFQYHSAPVYRLGKMIEIFDTSLVVKSKDPSSTRFNLPFYHSLSAEFGSVFSDLDNIVEDTSALEGQDTSDSMGLGRPEQSRGALDENYGSQMSRAGVAEAYSSSDEEHMKEEEEAEEESTEVSGDEFSLQRLPPTYPEQVVYLIKVFKSRTNLDSTTKAISHVPPATEQVVGALDAVHAEEGPSIDGLNIIDPNFRVDTLRSRILDHPRQEIQESAFHVMAAEVAKISFKVQRPKDNWKETMGLTYLCYAMDCFEEYANSLRKACCVGQYHEALAIGRAAEAERQATEAAMLAFDPADLQMDASTHYVADDGDEFGIRDDGNLNAAASENGKGISQQLSKESMRPTKSRTKESFLAPSQEISIVPSLDRWSKLSFDDAPMSATSSTGDIHIAYCLHRHPRQTFAPTRYRDQYYSRLYTRMYQILSDCLDTMDTVWNSKKTMKMDPDELGFIKIKDIHPGVNIDDYLQYPPPPKWIKVAQTIDTIAASNKKRLTEVRAPDI